MLRILPAVLKQGLYVAILPSKLSVLLNSVVRIKVDFDMGILSKVYSTPDNVLLNLPGSLECSLRLLTIIAESTFWLHLKKLKQDYY